jgi:hypothetical protein
MPYQTALFFLILLAGFSAMPLFVLIQAAISAIKSKVAA